jgi:general secretion pathway protein B
MSYILDALRRADAERERDPARGIHARPAAAPPAGESSRAPGWAWPAGAVAIVLLAGLLLWQRQEPVAPAAAAVANAGARAPAPIVPVAAVVSPPAPAALPVPVPAERVRTAVAPAAAAARSGPAPGLAAPPVPAAAASAAAPAGAGSPAAASDRVYNVAELPADVQRELPKLAIAGGVHSENAAQRMLIVGGQVVNEGAELAPGVVLEQIRARTAVLRFRGYRYSVGY